MSNSAWFLYAPVGACTSKVLFTYLSLEMNFFYETRKTIRKQGIRAQFCDAHILYTTNITRNKTRPYLSVLPLLIRHNGTCVLSRLAPQRYRSTYTATQVTGFTAPCIENICLPHSCFSTKFLFMTFSFFTGKGHNLYLAYIYTKLGYFCFYITNTCVKSWRSKTRKSLTSRGQLTCSAQQVGKGRNWLSILAGRKNMRMQ